MAVSIQIDLVYMGIKRNRTMKDQRVVGKHNNNPVAKQLSDPLWKQRILKNKKLYDRKLKHKENFNVGYSTNRSRG